ncbi:hypothetical protein ACJMK2_034434 [Sinanodonta woodiana]|uniref:Uncharacterized protein n=1 Tax=Sinanodonta woodiana TaxID=1069815 RepID=A0ABD3WVE5_SINWO
MPTLCCIDKKGILSWPNPSAEKLFFLRGADTGLISRNSVDGTGDAENLQVSTVVEVKQSEKKRKRRDSGGYGNPAVVEVLDITHDQKMAFGLHFDDPSWKKHLSSLKPLGLNILANTCNLATGEWYTRFTDHVACAALENEDTVSVVNKRCLCELAREIGFSEQAVQIFELENSLGMYRQVSAEETAREKLQRAKSFVQHKIPMPNMVSVIVRENVSGVCQMLSQGTADILLDCCSDYWNGENIAVLTENDRKKIVDFYHRSSMAAYCTAFSYRPFSQRVSNNLEDIYIELPDRSLHQAQHDHLNLSINNDTSIMSEPGMMWDKMRAFSMDSLFENTSVSSIEDANSCYQSQCSQTFIGMVTMQYQARQDFVQMIDKLELACIRFVHFSQENEVRSRVFSEKMGLEAGWNCHISLLSDNRTQFSSTSANTSGRVSQVELSNRSNPRYSSRRSTDSCPVREYTPMISKSSSVYMPIKSRSYSAPSIVNLDSALVKFESIVKTTILSNRSSCKPGPEEEPEEEEEERVPLVGVEERVEEQHETHYVDDANFDSDDGESRHTSSYFTENTEDSFTGGLDNRAKLPRGIQNIRPHLRSIDNVPLLVNLFTDCTTETTLEMISIMQEYGEVVLCMGSSVNIQNTPVFLQADSSLAMEPMYPQMCIKQSVMVEPWDETHITPTHLASILLNIPCPLIFRRNDNTSVIHLIAEARTHLMLMRNCFYFMLCCHLSVSLVQLLSSMLLLPVVIDTQHLLWLLLVIIPMLSLSMMGNTVDPRIMGAATGKNKDHISTEVLLQFIVYFLIRFLPPTCVALLCYGLTLHSFCLADKTNSTNCSLYSFTQVKILLFCKLINKI